MTRPSGPVKRPTLRVTRELGAAITRSPARGPQQDAAQRAVLAVPARSSATVNFSFEVPSFVPEGAQFCQSVYLGLEPSALLSVIEQQELFCIQKSGNRFARLADERMADEFVERDEQSIDRRLRSRGIAAPK